MTRLEPKFLRFGDVLAALPHVDAPDVLDRIKSDRALESALRWSRPPNWWGAGIAGERISRIATQDGIPIVWVPDKELVVTLEAASHRDARIALLLEHHLRVVTSCKEALSACTDPSLDGVIPLAHRSVHAWEEGHQEAAMALAVALCDPLALKLPQRRIRLFDTREEFEAWDRKKKGYQWAREEARRDSADPIVGLWEAAICGPISGFFELWFPDGTAPPTRLSRHVVAHNPHTDHFTRANSLLSLMLMTSLIREMQAWIDDSSEVFLTSPEN